MVSEFPWERRYRVSDMEKCANCCSRGVSGSRCLKHCPDLASARRQCGVAGGCTLRPQSWPTLWPCWRAWRSEFQICNHARTPSRFLAHLQFQFLWQMLAFRFEPRRDSLLRAIRKRLSSCHWQVTSACESLVVLSPVSQPHCARRRLMKPSNIDLAVVLGSFTLIMLVILWVASHNPAN
jgi:hypothetical protein